MIQAPFRKVAMAPPRVEATVRPDGAILLRSPEALGPYEQQIGELLRRWAQARPDRVFLAQRDPVRGGDWRRVSYGEARERVDAISQALLDRGLGPDRPVLALSGNGIDHALLAFAAMQVGIPFAPVSPAYSLMSGDFSKVALIRDLVKPGLVFADDGARFARVLEGVAFEAELVVSRNPPPGRAATRFARLGAAVPGPAVEAVAAAPHVSCDGAAIDPSRAAK